MSATVVRSLDIAAPIASVWSVLAAFDELAHWAPDVDHSCGLQRPGAEPGGVGAARRVQIGRTTLVETVTEWSPGHRLAYDIGGLPPVLRGVSNTWDLEDTGQGTAVVLTTAVDAGPKPPRRAVARIVAARLGRSSDSLLRGLAAAATGSTAPGGDPHG